VAHNQIGYSGKLLHEKLGIKEGMAGLFLNVPSEYKKYARHFPKTMPASSNLDFIHYFAKEKKDLERDISSLKKKLKDNGMLWISWPKKGSNLKSDLNENIIREVILGQGMVDIKVCAVDEVWSGLKIVIRKENRNAL